MHGLAGSPEFDGIGRQIRSFLCYNIIIWTEVPLLQGLHALKWDRSGAVDVRGDDQWCSEGYTDFSAGIAYTHFVVPTMRIRVVWWRYVPLSINKAN